MSRVPPVDREFLDRARARQDRLTKPPGSLGRLEEAGVRLAAIQRTERPRLGPGAVVVAAADHGVTAEGVSAYPAEVTPQMVLNFLAGGAAINQIARAAGAEVYVLDVGVNGPEFPAHERLIPARVRPGTGNLVREPAMSPAEAMAALQAGENAARRAVSEGATLLAAGDMGIGNTTAAAALTAALLGLPASEVTGRGTGVDDAAYARKLAVVERALARAAAELGDLAKADPLDVAAQLGGLEIVAAAGVFLAAAAAGLPVVTDGFPVTAGALLAARLEPNLKDYLFAGHRSVEPGHARQLEALGLEPLLDLELRLGEGTGAVLAFPVLRAAAAVLAGMATFDEAGVSEG
ncbi:nicotinate-nucleotide/dimethylbenzimidazole phosphoribosyltransferase [Oceanithermus profundus DSM 14977]|uniref:Nicotinate-nucleotide--dimethylbenzimidazole phosphoribosyltransferase n=1 Tax=Oceanithermus profundus (strain DSM 14977 / NBRC 100410 / VKM B-2274 / 506) TaxID=670487 RepID=E4U6T2_OCEP5|nr:nicotinate-nucleotide--dimethylbenzimidazole phosphoribosyltransferase [Oceanithermus profundus]ADR35876.1 nicotinate-nucleotide/dimethylbenzimidazole phosphoribosyltransferase [Oceanithermus profundus DSM 14977]